MWILRKTAVPAFGYFWLEYEGTGIHSEKRVNSEDNLGAEGEGVTELKV